MGVGLLLASNVVALVCIVVAGFLGYHRRDGWGWFLLVGALTAVSTPALLSKVNLSNAPGPAVIGSTSGSSEKAGD